MKPCLPAALAIIATAALTGCTASLTHGHGGCSPRGVSSFRSASCGSQIHCRRGSSSSSSSASSSSATSTSTSASASASSSGHGPHPHAHRPTPTGQPATPNRPELRPRPGWGQPQPRPDLVFRPRPRPGADTPSQPPEFSPETGHGWDMLGFSRLDFQSSQGSVVVSRKRDPYRTLRLHVGGTPLELSQLRVVFADGSSYLPGGTYAFHTGSWTHVIALPLPARVVDRLEFTYGSSGQGTGNATIRLFGQH